MSLPAFDEIACHREPLADGIAFESEWLAHAADTGRATAHLWRSPQMLVVPRSYVGLPGWAEACTAAAAAGWPVRVRGSGGGLVPLGSGVLNLSLVWRTPLAAAIDPHTTYRGICGALGRALAAMSIRAMPAAVEGSFCDGRFNVAVGGRKIAGTAQAWKRVGAHHVVLAHAVIVVSADADLLTGVANRFEALAASGRRYRADALTSVARSWCDAHGAIAPPRDLDDRWVDTVAAVLADADSSAGE